MFDLKNVGINNSMNALNSIYVTTTLRKQHDVIFFHKKYTFFYRLDLICVLHTTKQILENDTAKLRFKKDSNL